jgi:hypothetical protein
MSQDLMLGLMRDSLVMPVLVPSSAEMPLADLSS